MEKLPDNQKEQPKITAGTMSGAEFRNFVYGDESSPRDPRLRSWKNGGVFRYLMLDKINGHRKLHEMAYPHVMSDGQIVALAELEKNPYDKTGKTWWTTFVSVEPAFKDKKLGSKLIDEIFRYAKEQGIIIGGSKYTDEGRLKIKRKMAEMAEKYGVTFLDPDDREE